jgi:hypothetical protein
MNNKIGQIVLIFVCIAISSCGRDNRVSGTVQRVTIYEGMVVLELSDNQFLVAEPATLVDNTDLLVGILNDRPLPAFFEAIQSWKGRSVTCTGESKVTNGKKSIVIARDRSNLTIH